MTAAATKTRCEVVDQIVRWDQVREGDLALVNGALELVRKIEPPTDDWATFLCDDGYAYERKLTDYTAVARYLETTEE